MKKMDFVAITILGLLFTIIVASQFGLFSNSINVNTILNETKKIVTLNGNTTTSFIDAWFQQVNKSNSLGVERDKKIDKNIELNRISLDKQNLTLYQQNKTLQNVNKGLDNQNTLLKDVNRTNNQSAIILKTAEKQLKLMIEMEQTNTDLNNEIIHIKNGTFERVNQLYDLVQNNISKLDNKLNEIYKHIINNPAPKDKDLPQQLAEKDIKKTIK